MSLLGLVFLAQTAIAAEPLPAPISLEQRFAEDGGDLVMRDVAGGWGLGFHGYVRMPIRFVDSPLGERGPYLIDDHYTESGFAYLPVNETEWAELVLSAEHGRTRVVAGIFASEFSDWAEQPSKGHSTPATAFAEHTWDTEPLDVRLRMGMFWERMGYLDSYDTYVFGRTHIGGASLHTKILDVGYLRAGFGAHARTQVRGFSPLGWVVAGADLWGWADIGLYGLKTWTDDDDDQFNESFQKGSLTVWGVDAKGALPYVGKLHFAFAFYDADKTEFIGESLELLHSSGGNNLRQNFLGNIENGTGEIQVTAVELLWQPHRTLAAGSRDAARALEGLDLRFFELSAHVATPHERAEITDDFKNDRVYFKWGGELFYRPVPTGWSEPFVALRYDRVLLDADHESLAFRVVTPRIGVTPAPGMDFFVAYSNYGYGANLQPRREVLNRVGEDTRPDEHVFKLQAEAAW